MPRPKRIRLLPVISNYIDEDGKPFITELISEETESFGAGASKKIQNYRNFEIGLNHIANLLFFQNSHKKKELYSLITKEVSLVGISRELQFTNIKLEERAMRTLAKKIKKAIQACLNGIAKYNL
jgi:hypothetical protein